MFRNYLITALRNFTRHKLYSFINIAGLAVGLTCAIFIILFVRDELSYDKWIPGTENLYRIELTFHVPDQPPMRSNSAAFPMPDAMQAQIPEVKSAIHLEPRQMTVAIGDRQFLGSCGRGEPQFLPDDPASAGSGKSRNRLRPAGIGGDHRKHGARNISAVTPLSARRCMWWAAANSGPMSMAATSARPMCW